MKSYTCIDIIPTFFFNYKSKKGDQKKKNHFATKNIIENFSHIWIIYLLTRFYLTIRIVSMPTSFHLSIHFQTSKKQKNHHQKSEKKME